MRSDLPLAAISVQSLDNQPIEASRDILISLSTRTKVEKKRPPTFRVEPLAGTLRIKAVPDLSLHDLQGNTLPAAYENGWYNIDLTVASGKNWLKLIQ